MKTQNTKTTMILGAMLCVAYQTATAGLFDGIQTAIGDVLTPKTSTQMTEREVTATLPPVTGPRHTIAVGEFEMGANARHLGNNDLRTMLESALTQCGRFRVVNRTTLNSMLKEQGLAESGMADANLGTVRMGQLKQAAFIAEGYVTAVSEDTSASQSAIKLGGFGFGLNKKSTTISLTLKISDATSGEILVQRDIVGQANKSGVKFGGEYSGFGGGTDNNANNPVAEAAHDCINQAVTIIATAMADVAPATEPRDVLVRVMKVQSEQSRFVVSPGSAQGLTIGQTINFLGPTDEFGFATGESIEAKVVSVNDQYAQCSLVSGPMPAEQAETTVQVLQ